MGRGSTLASGSRTIGESTSGGPASHDEMVVDEKVACAIFGEVLLEEGKVTSGLCGGNVVGVEARG